MKDNLNSVKSGVHSKTLFFPCSKCAAKDVCPKFNVDEEGLCWYEKNDVRPDLKTAQGILEVLEEKANFDYIRYQRGLRFRASIGDGTVDTDLTSLSNSLTRSLQVLADLGVRFGVIETEKIEEESKGHITVDQVNILNISRQEIEECQTLTRDLELLRKQQVELSKQEQILTLPKLASSTIKPKTKS